MTSFLVASLLVTSVAGLVVSWLKRMPTGQTCRRCAQETHELVSPPWMKPVDRWLALRWCPACESTRVGRRGPEFVRGRQIAHDSGFHWGADVVGENMGFAWRQEIVPEPEAEPPHHPSGFRFGDQLPSLPESPLKAHPSGFRWAGADGSPGVERRRRDHPSGFLWGERSTDRGGLRGRGHASRRRTDPRGIAFEWKRRESGGRRNDDSPGFRWG